MEQKTTIRGPWEASELLVSDGYGNARVHKFSPAGEFLGGPHGIWMDSHGDLYVGEVGVDGRLQKFVRQ